MNKKFIEMLKSRAEWVRKETLKIHKISQEMRIASCLSDVEIFTVLYYGKILKFKPSNPLWDERDRFIISKSHGAFSLYPILADLGFFKKEELEKVGKPGSLLPGGIPDCRIPGFETINGSLGHGLGVACGVAWALKRKGSDSKVFVLSGDGELYEGAVWEAVMFSAHHKLDNLILIVDHNKISMLDYCKNIIDISPLSEKFKAFGWKVRDVDGHNVEELYMALNEVKNVKYGKPKVIIAHTKKGKGVKKLEADSLCHIRSLKPEEIDLILKGEENE